MLPSGSPEPVWSLTVAMLHKNMNKKLILVGAGGFGREVLAWSKNAFPEIGISPVSGFLDDNPDALAGFNIGIPYFGAISDYEPQTNDFFLLGIASPIVKKKVTAILKIKKAKFVSLIHPTAIVAASALIGDGVIICPFALVSADVQIGDFVTINAMSSVGHDSKVGAFSTLSGHVDITGQVVVGENVFFGTGAKLLPRISIGNEAVIGAGCTVVRSVRANTTVYTAPARRLGALPN